MDSELTRMGENVLRMASGTMRLGDYEDTTVRIGLSDDGKSVYEAGAGMSKIYTSHDEGVD